MQNIMRVKLGITVPKYYICLNYLVSESRVRANVAIKCVQISLTDTASRRIRSEITCILTSLNTIALRNKYDYG